MTKDDLNNDEYNLFYQSYIQRTGSLDLYEGLKVNGNNTIDFFEGVPEDKLNVRYAEGKWTIKEILQHLIDTERIFGYRALCISRGDQTLFPGFDHEAYVVNCDANDRSMHDLVNEYKAVRLSTLMLFNSFSADMLLKMGIASNNSLSVRACGFIIIGHEMHHCQIIKEKYL